MQFELCFHFSKLQEINDFQQNGSTHKIDNPVRVITSRCGTAVENSFIFVEICLFLEGLKIESRVQDTSGMLNFFHITIFSQNSPIGKCNRICDICKNFLAFL